MRAATSDLCVVILAGGSGTRFWPASTPERPKQFLTLFGRRSMLQQTWDRVRGLVPPARVLVVTGAAFTATVAEHLPEVPPANVIGEPVARDTAGAIALAARVARARFGDPVMVVLPADHMIRPRAAFQADLRAAIAGAASGEVLYTFGIPPSYPATAYGYLERGRRLEGAGGGAEYALRRFKEKPDLATARTFLRSGRFYWNAGIFVWRASRIWAGLARHLPDHVARLERLEVPPGRAPSRATLTRALEPLARVSIDFGVMEKESGIRIVPAGFEWSDVGGWLALEGDYPEDEAGNRCRGRVEVLDARENFVFNEDEDETVGLIGVRDLVVVRSGKATLIAAKDRVEELKQLVSTKVYRPGRPAPRRPRRRAR